MSNLYKYTHLALIYQVNTGSNKLIFLFSYTGLLQQLSLLGNAPLPQYVLGVRTHVEVDG